MNVVKKFRKLMRAVETRLTRPPVKGACSRCGNPAQVVWAVGEYDRTAADGLTTYRFHTCLPLCRGCEAKLRGEFRCH